MIKIPASIQKTINVLTLFVFTLPVIVIVLKNYRYLIPLPIFLDILSKIMSVILITSCLSLPLLLFSSIKVLGKLITGILYAPVCVFLLLLQPNEYITSSLTIDERNIHLTNNFIFPDANTVYHLYECNSNDLECKEIKDFFLSSGFNSFSTELVADGNDVYVFANGYLKYTYGKVSRIFDITLVDPVSLGSYDYFIAASKYTDPEIIVLYRVNSVTLTNAEVLPFQYATSSYSNIELKIDEEANKILIYVDNKLIYIYVPAS